MINLKNISPNTKFSIRINKIQPKLSINLENEVNRLWKKEQNRRGKTIFNGRIISASTISNEGIDGYVTEYRYLIAQHIRPELFEELHVRPIAVSGLFKCTDGIILGHRAASMTQDANLWELAPSGGIDVSKVRYKRAQQTTINIDFFSQILAELHQELGIKSNYITKINPFCLVNDTNSHVLDIGIAMESQLSYHEVLTAHQKTAIKEYDKLHLIPQSKINEFIQHKTFQLVKVSTALIQNFYKLTAIQEI